ncbi:MAG: NUDIX hydrolase [Rhodothermales bacterium]
MKDLREERLSSKSVFSGLLLDVYRDVVRLPDGSEGVRERIVHPGASAVVPVLPDGRVILVRQFRYALDREFLEVPAGKLDGPEDRPERAALRELAEETGWTCDELVPLGAFHPAIGFSNECIYFFLARSLREGIATPDHDEFLDVVYLPLRDALQRVTDGAITDMKTALALRLAADSLAGTS